MQVVAAQRRYWYFVRKVKESVPRLDVFQINLHPSKVDKVPLDHDGVVNRQADIMLGDKTAHDETILLIFQTYAELTKKLIKVARDHGVKQEIIDEMLDKPLPEQERFVDVRGTKYRDVVEGAFNMGDILRVERKHDEHSVSSKIFDFSSNTIKRLLEDGYNDVVDHIRIHFGSEQLMASGIKSKLDFA
jgi:hypothetical protein